MAQHVSRSISLVVAFIGAVFNFVIAVRLLALWGSLRWEQESEWEGSPDSWRIDPVKLIWGLLSVYFAAAATASTVGFIGIARNWAAAVRFFRDYTIADFAFIAISTVTVAYTSFSTSYVRTGVCEELSRQPELMRDIVETGLSLDNCEFWFERAVVVLLGMLFLLIAVRNRYIAADLPASHQFVCGPPPTSSGSHSRSKTEDIVVYAPVPLGGLSEQDARDLNATEAWISTSSSTSQQTRSHRHTHSHPHPHSHSTQTHRSRRNSAPYQPPPSSPPEEKLIDTSD
ncbi:hypothetical protein NLI96_g2642 [Meripilus lineatus]|uniref:Uncharacterized protein n=1 Tax=Meripilus lineatus TaxID=2056292 RepID=A0AAD5YJS9_9APHY|nr:hypothetical protein NLI96_g2642 [Physisporinus lineatus]